MRQPAAVHPFSGPHRRPGCRGADLLRALPGACPLAPAGGRSGPAGGHAAAAPPGRHCHFSPRKSWNFCSARRRCGWRFSLSCGGTPSWCFWPAPRASTPLPARTMHSGRGSPSLPRGWPPRRSVVCCKKTARRKNCPASPPGSYKRSYKKRTKPPPVGGGFASQGFQFEEDCGLFG